MNFSNIFVHIKSRGRAVGVLAWSIARRPQVQVLLPLLSVCCMILLNSAHPLAARSGGFYIQEGPEPVSPSPPR